MANSSYLKERNAKSAKGWEYFVFQTKLFYRTVVGCLTILVLFSTIMTSAPLLSMSVVRAQPAPLTGTTFPPPIFATIRSLPSYSILIPFSSQGKPNFQPQEVAIPTGMTIIWFNNDAGQHTVTTLANKTYSPPESIDSGVIVQDGGSFIHQFNHPGKYVYYDQFNPSVHGIITVGSTIEMGKNFNMYVGGMPPGIPFNPNKTRSFVLSFVPKTVSFPPIISMTYNVTLLDSNKPLYSHNYDDSDGILDLEIVPTHKVPLSSATNSTSSNNMTSKGSGSMTSKTPIREQFTTWGPDFIGQVPFHTTGTFHIRGPVLVENSPYSIRVSIIARDDKALQNPITETFLLPQRMGK